MEENRDSIEICGLRLSVSVGVLPHERPERQTVLACLTLYPDCIAAAGQGDRLADTVDYAAVCARVVQAASERHFDLLEALAERIAAACLEDSRVRGVRVRVEKPGAVPAAKTVAVTLTRESKRKM